MVIHLWILTYHLKLSSNAAPNYSRETRGKVKTYPRCCNVRLTRKGTLLRSDGSFTTVPSSSFPKKDPRKECLQKQIEITSIILLKTVVTTPEAHQLSARQGKPQKTHESEFFGPTTIKDWVAFPLVLRNFLNRELSVAWMVPSFSPHSKEKLNKNIGPRRLRYRPGSASLSEPFRREGLADQEKSLKLPTP